MYMKNLNLDRKSTRLNSSHLGISYAVFCLKKKKQNILDSGLQHSLRPLSMLPTELISIPTGALAPGPGSSCCSASLWFIVFFFLKEGPPPNFPLFPPPASLPS